ncbi:MAG: RuBisCO large subunit C-terminal-like domain-containing protein [Candidatus Nanopelagicaceae bacterium]|nr:RuBisCO large subunit C-terminal-like domain-containing protein [Candidatus Nanopelagicaceae bacterium]
MIDLNLSDRLQVTYRYLGSDPKQIADVIRVEQSIEFPFELAGPRIQEEVVGKIEEIESNSSSSHLITISYDINIVGGELTQFLNVLWGNVSLFPGVRIVDLHIPNALTKKFQGPRFGISGLRNLFGAHTRPLLTTALKPMGSDSKTLAQMARTLALAGFDMIKDDHSLANQPWATWHERVKLVSAAVLEANEMTGGKCAYAPSLNLPFDQIADAAHTAKELGAKALLVLPGLTGFDSMRSLADDESLSLPIQAHPSMLGSLVISPNEGIAHGIVFATLMRLAGADVTIFPSVGGRFSFTADQCIEIGRLARSPLGDIEKIWIAPAGGMTIERIPQLIEMYGDDTALLIGGALHQGDLALNAQRMVDVVAALPLTVK